MPIQPALPRLLLICLLGLALGPAAVSAQEAPEQPSIFDLPILLQRQATAQAAALSMLSRGELETAERILLESIERIPHDFRAHYNLACVLARQGKTEQALERLGKAVELGFRDPDHIKGDMDLASLRDAPQFAAAVELAKKKLEKPVSPWSYEPEDAVPSGSEVTIGEEHAAWIAQVGIFRVAVKFPEQTDKPVAVGLGEPGKRLRRWWERREAAGNHGDLYDNHDRDHSNMNYRALPQLTRVEYAEEVGERNLDHGLQRHFLFGKQVTIGNSSTALTSGPFWRSQARLATTQPNGLRWLHLQYRSNHLYFYPEHRDHDPGRNGADGGGYGDVFAVNTPYLIISQGSSGSDRAFMDAVAQTLAAFRPEVKGRLADQGLLMPAVQMIFRKSNKQVESDEDYLTGKAHPTVFDGKQLDVLEMVDRAHELQLDSLPPLARLKVVEEDQGQVGVDYFDAAPRTSIGDTPGAIGRVFRTTWHAMRMVVSAESSLDLNEKPLSYHWSVLRGDASRIGIRPLNDEGSVVELTIPYHTREDCSKGQPIESNRVDIGAFVHNGQHHSAPAFVSVFFLDNEQRTYDGDHRIQVVDYAGDRKDFYVDPLIDAPKNWRDEYRYDDAGELAGWTRIRGDRREQFTADGRLILEKDGEGRPKETAAVRYEVERQPDGSTQLQQRVVGR